MDAENNKCSSCSIFNDPTLMYFDWLKISHFIRFMHLQGKITESMKEDIEWHLRRLKPNIKGYL